MDKTAGRSRRKSRRAVLRSLLTMAILLAAYYLLPLDSAFTTETVLGLVVGIAGRLPARERPPVGIAATTPRATPMPMPFFPPASRACVP
ncbi:hypothetical protein [Streptomyces sp. NPDC048272]|uniref:hypothetical protein n=1 Tax=Streptomyces sp. NPDC048272 TaxID=3154616 RepID=UPI003416B5D8